MKKDARTVSVLACLALILAALAQTESSPIFKYEGGDWVNSVSVSADGKWFVAGGDLMKIWVFKLMGNKVSKAWEYKYSGYSYVNSVAISADGSAFVAGCNDGWVRCYSNTLEQTGQATLSWEYQVEKISPYARAVAISGDGKRVIAGSSDGHVTLFSEDGTPLWRGKYGYIVIAVALSRNGRISAAATDNGLYIFDDSGLRFVKEGYTTCVAISADGSTIVAGTRDGKVLMLTDNGSVVREWNPGVCVFGVDVTPDGNSAVAAAGSETAKFILYKRDGTSTLLMESTSPASSVAISSDGTKVFAADMATVYYLEGQSLKWKSTLVTGIEGNVESIDMSDGGDYMIACTSRSDKEHKVYIFGKEVKTPSQPTALPAGTNMVLVAVVLVVVIVVLIVLLRRRAAPGEIPT